MSREVYKGRKLLVRKGRDWGQMVGYVNGVPVTWPITRDDEVAMQNMRSQIDFIDREPVNGDRWGAEWYAPGTYKMCDEGIHPVTLDGECQHFTCIRKAAS